MLVAGLTQYDSLQMLDELPMLYSMCVWWWLWFEMRYQCPRRTWLAPVLAVVSAIVTYLHVVQVLSYWRP